MKDEIKLMFIKMQLEIKITIFDFNLFYSYMRLPFSFYVSVLCFSVFDLEAFACESRGKAAAKQVKYNQ